MIHFAMCNEFCEGWNIDDVFRLAAEVGYEGVEIAPFTLAESVTDISGEERKRIRLAAEERGLRIAGLHWLLASPKGLYMNHPDAALRQKTRQYFAELIRFCADLRGDRMVIGSPKQRNVVDGETYEATWDRTVEFYKHVAPIAGDHGVMLGMEPLGRKETNFLNTKDDVVRLIEEVNHPNYRLTLANDDNSSYPGTGYLDFASIMAALRETDYHGWVSLEVFDFSPGPGKIAREGLQHLKDALGPSAQA